MRFIIEIQRTTYQYARVAVDAASQAQAQAIAHSLKASNVDQWKTSEEDIHIVEVKAADDSAEKCVDEQLEPLDGGPVVFFPDVVRDACKRVLDYLYDDEVGDDTARQPGGRARHVFRSIRVLDQWLALHERN